MNDQATKISADLIRARDLGPAVEKAIKLASAKIGPIDADENFFVPKWEIVGRRLRDAALAEKFADAVAEQINAGGGVGGAGGVARAAIAPRVVPAVFKFDKFIIAGFIERLNLPVFRGL